MKITIDQQDGAENEIILRCASLDGEMLRVLALLRAQDQRLCAWRDGELALLTPEDVLYAESVEDKTFLYCENQVCRTPLTLGELELRCRELGYCRVSRTMVANLRRVASLRSLPAGRIECTMQNGERLIASRRYAPLLREQLGVDR